MIAEAFYFFLAVDRRGGAGATAAAAEPSSAAQGLPGYLRPRLRAVQLAPARVSGQVVSAARDNIGRIEFQDRIIVVAAAAAATAAATAAAATAAGPPPTEGAEEAAASAEAAEEPSAPSAPSAFRCGLAVVLTKRELAFHPSDVDGSGSGGGGGDPGVRLRPGDGVDFTLAYHPQRKEAVLRRVRRTREAPRGEGEAAEAEEVAAARPRVYAKLQLDGAGGEGQLRAEPRIAKASERERESALGASGLRASESPRARKATTRSRVPPRPCHLSSRLTDSSHPRSRPPFAHILCDSPPPSGSPGARRDPRLHAGEGEAPSAPAGRRPCRVVGTGPRVGRGVLLGEQASQRGRAAVPAGGRAGGSGGGGGGGGARWRWRHLSGAGFVARLPTAWTFLFSESQLHAAAPGHDGLCRGNIY